MKLKTTLAGTLALLAPAATALAQVPGESYETPWIAPQRATTQVRVVPPLGGEVLVYDGHRLLGRFNQPGAMTVVTGRSYRIVATRGDDVIWSGTVGTTGAPLDLSWAPETRYREPTMPRYPAPPRGYDEGQPRYYDEGPPPEAGVQAAPVMPDVGMRALLRTLDEQSTDADRLEAVSEAASRYAFTVPQVDWMLMRFQSDRYRLAALARVRDRLVDPEDGWALARRFVHPSARAQARAMLAW